MGWRLLSNRQVGTLEQAVELIDWYRARWEIKLFFLILKEDCRIEALQLGSAERIETALALYLERVMHFLLPPKAARPWAA